MTGFFSILKSKDFSKLWSAQVLSQLAFNMLNFALILKIYRSTGSITSVSLVLISSALPSIIFGPFSGVIADRLNYKTILVFTNILRFFAVLLLILADGNVLAILEVVFLINAFTQFFAPAENSSFPLIVSKEHLINANSLSISTLYGALLIGYSIGGPVYAAVGSTLFFVFCATMYLVSAVLCHSMSNYDHKEIRKLSILTLAKDVSSVWADTKNGIRYIYTQINVRSPLIKFSLGWVVLGAFVVLLPAFGESVLKIAAANVGWSIIAPAGLGMLIGAYILQKKSQTLDKRQTVDLGFIIISLGLIALVVYPLYQPFFFARILMVLFTMVLGFGTSMVYISSQTMLHMNSDSQMRGRVFGITLMLANLAMSVPGLIIGGLADLSSPLIAMAILGILLFVYALQNFAGRNWPRELGISN